MNKTTLRLVNELTELKCRVEDLAAHVKYMGLQMQPAEKQLIVAQAEAMKLYAEMLAARMYLITGPKAA